jgi:hypothetical protein
MKQLNGTYKIKTREAMMNESGLDVNGLLIHYGFTEALEEYLPKNRIINITNNVWNYSPRIYWNITEQMIEYKIPKKCKHCVHEFEHSELPEPKFKIGDTVILKESIVTIEGIKHTKNGATYDVSYPSDNLSVLFGRCGVAESELGKLPQKPQLIDCPIEFEKDCGDGQEIAMAYGKDQEVHYNEYTNYRVDSNFENSNFHPKIQAEPILAKDFVPKIGYWYFVADYKEPNFADKNRYKCFISDDKYFHVVESSEGVFTSSNKWKYYYPIITEGL